MERISSNPAFPWPASGDWFRFGSTVPSCYKRIFVGGDWRGLSFRSARLDHVRITTARLTRCDFDNVDFKSSGFSEAECVDCSFHDAVFRGSDDTHATVFTRCIFSRSRWDDYEFRNCVFEFCDFNAFNANGWFFLRNATFFQCDIPDEYKQLFIRRGATVTE
jgi:uncharacterized protein YjbI with pentapeptide repeats